MIIEELGLVREEKKTRAKNVLETSKAQLKKSLSEFSRVYSLSCSRISERKDLFVTTDHNLSLFVAECRIFKAMKCFRQMLDKIVITYLERLSDCMD
jgi:hypothetical protein